jgi:hypothetical protein
MMTENQSNETRLDEEYRRLGENLIATLRIAWNSPNSQQLQQKIISGLSGLASVLSDATRSQGESAAAQRMEVENRYLSPPAEEDSPLQHELASALQEANGRIARVVERWASEPAKSGGKEMPVPAARQPGHQEVHPDDDSAPPADTGHHEVHPDDVEAEDTAVDLGG